MKIGITCYSTCGGSGIVATELGKCLANKGHDIHFITQDIPFRLEHTLHEKIKFHKVETFEYPLFDSYFPYTLSLASKMAQVIKGEGLDVFHVHYVIPHAISAFLAQQMLKSELEIPIVTTLHGTDITLVGQHPSFSDITKFSIENSTAVTAVSDYLVSQTREKFKIDKNIQTIHNFVDPNLFRMREYPWRKKSGIECDQIVFIHLSNFRPFKRSYDVVKTFNRVQKEIPNAVLWMAGEGPLLGECRELVIEYGIQSKVNFLGKVQNIASLLSMSDIMLFPSDSTESFGLAALEANACGIPVIGCLSGGIKEAVANCETAFLFDVGDVKSMAQKAIEIINDCELMNRLSISARKRVVNEFSPEIIVPQYEDVYIKAIDKMT